MRRLPCACAALLALEAAAEVIESVADSEPRATVAPARSLDVTYATSLQPLVGVSVGGQPLHLVFDTSSGNTIVFVKENDTCLPPSLQECYSTTLAQERRTLRVCRENNDNDRECSILPPRNAPPGTPPSVYACNKFSNLSNTTTHKDSLIIDGIQYDQDVIEVREDMLVNFRHTNGSLSADSPDSFARVAMPARLLMGRMKVLQPLQKQPLPEPACPRLFEGAGGLLGCSGPTLSCRNETLWNAILQDSNASQFALDLHPAPNVTGVQAEETSRVVIGAIDHRYADTMVWSQPRQSGDNYSDGMHQFLMYHPEVCGIDLLYNTSSNWLSLIDTSAPCLTLPPFLFDRFRARVPIDCPFQPGELSQGRLCSPQRGALSDSKLPTLDFRLQDDAEPAPPVLRMPLERLAFLNASKHELLCVARDDSVNNMQAGPNMMSAHIAFGSMAASAFYMVFDLANHTVGFANKGDLLVESSERNCAESVVCRSSMQTYYPPLNICEDPRCSDYMFMTLDEDTKICRWSSAVPASFVGLLVVLGFLDLISHRLYKQAIEKASEYCQ